MALMDFIKKQFIDVIQWTESSDGTLAWRYPMQDMEIQNGAVLVQQAARRGWPCAAIDSKLTALGKDERAISVSGYVYRGLKPVNWCFDCGSALAEAEVEYQEKRDPAIDVGFKFAQFDALARQAKRRVGTAMSSPDRGLYTDLRSGKIVQPPAAANEVDPAKADANGWAVTTAEIGYVAKTYPELDDTARAEVGEFLQELEDNDDVQRVWAAVK